MLKRLLYILPVAVVLLGISACDKEDKVDSGGGAVPPVTAPTANPSATPNPSPGTGAETFGIYNDAGGILGEADVLLFTGGGLNIAEVASGGTEGTKFLRSTNAGPGAFWGVTVDKNNAGKVRNLSAYNGGSLRFDIRVNRAVGATERPVINLTDGNNQTQSVLLGTGVGFDPSKVDQWQSVVIPLASYPGIDRSKIRVPFAIAIDSPPGTPALTIDIDNVRWEK